MKKPKIDLGWFGFIWACAGIYLFVSGALGHDWFHLVGGMYLMFSVGDFEIIHWQGKE